MLTRVCTLAHMCMYMHRRACRVWPPSRSSLCVNTRAPLNVWTPLTLRSLHVRTYTHTPPRCGCFSSVALSHQPTGIMALGAAPQPCPLAHGPSPCPVSVLQTDFEKDVDLACRSGERLTGESDRWPSPGPTCFFFFPLCICSFVCPFPPLPPTPTLGLGQVHPGPGDAARSPGLSRETALPWPGLNTDLGLPQLPACLPHPPTPEASGRVWRA